MWQKYQGALLWNNLPHLTPPTEADAANALRTQGGWFARWTSDFDCGHETEWWYCICDTFTPIDQLTAKQRYRVNKGLKQCDVVNARKDVRTDLNAIFNLVEASFADYPAAYRPQLEKDAFKANVQGLLDNPDIDIWLVYTKENQLVGYCYCTKAQDIVWLTQVKVPTIYLGLEVNAALVHTLCSYYLQENRYKYICDGERNIKHMTNYQDFLVRVLNFRYAYCTLHVMYPRQMKMVVNILYPFRNLIQAIGKNHPTLYNVYCVLLQEQIRRSFKK